MTARHELYDEALSRAAAHARAWLCAVPSRKIGPRMTADQLAVTFGGPLSDEGCDAGDVVDELAAGAEPGLMAIASGRFFGWVMGGTLPAALGADWLVSAWDQNNGMRDPTPATAVIEETAGEWLVELLGLPEHAAVGFVTGGTMANFTCLGAARHAVLAGAGWDVNDGLTGSPRVHVLVGAERHDTVDLALRYLGLGRPTAVAVDGEGRIEIGALTDALDQIPDGEPIVLCLQAGNVHSGAFDPFAEAIAVAHARGAWVHVDGAFGLWAAACPTLRHLTEGVTAADSWATDAHKTLNVPYDCGVAVVAEPSAMRAAFGVHASYLVKDESGHGDPHERVPELSRRARGVPVWAVLRSLGRRGVADLVGGLAHRAHEIAEGVAQIDGVEVLNDVVYTQVCIAMDDDDRTRAVSARLLADGTVWVSGSRWRGRDVLRISVSNWSTDEHDVQETIEALRRAVSSDE